MNILEIRTCRLFPKRGQGALWFRTACPFKKAWEREEEALLGRRAEPAAPGPRRRAALLRASLGLKKRDPLAVVKNARKDAQRRGTNVPCALASQGGVGKAKVRREGRLPVPVPLRSRLVSLRSSPVLFGGK